MTRRQSSKPIVEDLVGGVQHEVGRLEQLGVSLDKGQRPGTNVFLNWARRVRADVERAVDHGPGNGWARGVDRLDAKERGNDGGGSLTIDHGGDGLGYVMGPDGHSALQQWTGFSQIAPSRLHRIHDKACEAGPEIELARKDIDINVERAEDALHRGITDKDGLVSSVAQRQARRH